MSFGSVFKIELGRKGRTSLPYQLPPFISMSNFSSWFFRLRYSSSKLFYRYRTLQNKYEPTVFNNHSSRNARSTSLLPFALALSAGSLALHPHFSPSFCDSDRFSFPNFFMSQFEFIDYYSFVDYEFRRHLCCENLTRFSHMILCVLTLILFLEIVELRP